MHSTTRYSKVLPSSGFMNGNPVIHEHSACKRSNRRKWGSWLKIKINVWLRCSNLYKPCGKSHLKKEHSANSLKEFSQVTVLIPVWVFTIFLGRLYNFVIKICIFYFFLKRYRLHNSFLTLWCLSVFYVFNNNCMLLCLNNT